MTDTDAKSYLSMEPKKVLLNQEMEKKRKHLRNCEKQRRHFTPAVISLDGMMGKEFLTTIRQLANIYATKSGKHYSYVCGFFRSIISIAAVRATHLRLCGSCIPSRKMSRQLPQWEDCAGMGLLRL